MKRIYFGILSAFLLMCSFSVSAQTVDELADILWNKTSCLELNAERRAAMEKMQVHADNCTHTYFGEYKSVEEWSAKEKEMEESGIIRFIAIALDKLVKEIPQTKVRKGEVAIWQLYNMGYIVKTKNQCFGIDLHHKHATKLAPFIDFLLISHNHSDHYWKPLIAEMEKLGKPVYSNFLDNGFKVVTGDSMQIGDIDIKVTTVDHNKKLLNFVNTYEINCYSSKKNGYVIYFTGDAHNYEQLNPTGPVDLFIPHLAVGLKMDKAVEKIQPKEVLMSHILELAHAIEKWRWSYEYGINECEKLNREGVYLPVWGEKLIMK